MKKIITSFFFLIAIAFAALAQTTVATGLSTPLGVAFKGTDLYVSEYGSNQISKVDITQPLPTSASQVINVMQPTGLIVVGDYLYFNTEFDIFTAGDTKTGRINLTNPTPVIEQVLTANIGSTLHQGFAVDGDILYIASVGDDDNEGVHKIDLSQPLPQAPVPVITGVDASGIALRGNEMYYGYFGTVASPNNTVYKFDLTQQNPVPSVVVAGLQGPDGLTFSGDTLYISESMGDKIVKIDVTDSNPVPVTLASGLGGPTLSVFDGLDLYFGQQNNGLVSKIGVNQLVFSDPASTCYSETAVVRGGGSPSGGTYSGPNVTDNGNGETFTFNAQVAGLGNHTITYSFGTQTTTAIISVVVGPSSSTSTEPVSCNGFSDGEASVMATGGTAPYSYTWSNSATTASITGVMAGIYFVTVTDANGCTAATSATITGPAMFIAASVVDSNISCNSLADGGATASATGGTAPYSYAWSNSATTASITGVMAGTYFVTVSDANGCTNSTSATITEPAMFVAASVVDSNISCNSLADGGATASATGGTAPYSYAWSNSATTASITGVMAGTYFVTVSDANGCTNSTSATITEPSAITLSISATSNTGSMDGTATVNASGGTGSYIYAWNTSPSQTTQTASNLSEGTYEVTVTDVNGCTATSSVVVELMADLPGDDCTDAYDISNLFGQPLNAAQTSGLYDNTGYNTNGDPADGWGCFADNGLHHTIWFAFIGDGNNYRIRSVQCNASDYIVNGDTQFGLYSGNDCSDLISVACNDDEDFGNNVYNAYLEILTEAGTTYHLMVDGYSDAQYTAIGEFCLEVTNLTPNAVTNIEQTDIQLFPNPTTGDIQLTNVKADQVQVFDSMGRLVFSAKQPGNSINISAAPAGVYFLKITEGEKVYTARAVKE